MVMEIVYKNMQDFQAVIRAWRLARWAGHAWGNVPDGALPEVWNLCPSLTAFAQLLPGYAVARGWVREGPAGWGILGPELVGQTPDEYRLRVWIGSHSQMRVDCYAHETVVRYEHGDRWAEVEAECTMDSVLVVSCDGYGAQPRDWARLARALCVAYDLRDSRAHDVMEILRNMMPTEQWAEFNTYFGLAGPEILVGPEGILAAI